MKGGSAVVGQGRPGRVELAADVGPGKAYGTLVAAPVGFKPADQEQATIDPKAVGAQSWSAVVGQGPPGSAELAANLGPEKAHRTPVAAPGGFKPADQVEVTIDPKAVGGQGWSAVVGQGRPGSAELAADVGPEKAHRTPVAAPGGFKPADQVQVTIDPKAVGVQSWSAVVGQGRPRCVELAANLGPEKAYGAFVAAPGGFKPADQEQVTIDLNAVGIKGGAGGVSADSRAADSTPV
jgi:hypothetical protein